MDGTNRRGRTPEPHQGSKLLQRSGTVHCRQEHVKNDEKLPHVQVILLQVSLKYSLFKIVFGSVHWVQYKTRDLIASANFMAVPA